jgi:hypothetical protein
VDELKTLSQAVAGPTITLPDDVSTTDLSVERAADHAAERAPA